MPMTPQERALSRAFATKSSWPIVGLNGARPHIAYTDWALDAGRNVVGGTVVMNARTRTYGFDARRNAWTPMSRGARPGLRAR